MTLTTDELSLELAEVDAAAQLERLARAAALRNAKVAEDQAQHDAALAAALAVMRAEHLEAKRLAQEALDLDLQRAWADAARTWVSLLASARPEQRVALLDRFSGIVYGDEVCKLVVRGILHPPTNVGLQPLPGEQEGFTS